MEGDSLDGNSISVGDLWNLWLSASIKLGKCIIEGNNVDGNSVAVVEN